MSRAQEETARKDVNVGQGATSEVGAMMALVATLADRILDAIRYAPLDDDVLAKGLGVGHRQSGEPGGAPSGGSGSSPAVHRA